METTNNIILRPAVKSAVMIRREMAKMPAVMDALGPVERAVFLASTAKTIAEYSGSELAVELNTTLKWIAKDIGYRATDESDTQYLVIRTAEILKRYYSHFTLKDFRMAFEMSITGELDDFLPKGRDGQPDRNHYQQFNAEYICKILNAYKGRRAWVLKKAHEATPRPEQKPDAERQAYYKNEARKMCVNAYYHFKYRGRLPYLTAVGEMLCYKILSDSGLADEIVVTEVEQRAILQRTINEFVRNGNVGDVNRLKKEGTRAKDVEYGSFVLARRKALERTFAWMVEQEIQITDYIKFE